MKRVRILTIVCVLTALVINLTSRSSAIDSSEELLLDPTWMIQQESVLTPLADRRPADQTFLTYPEWYLVFGPGEQADYYRSNTSTTFPLMSQVDGVWDSYSLISKQIEPYFEYNDDYHFMIQFIGVSTTVEYGLKRIYELAVGRLTEPKSNDLTAEDQFNFEYTRDYVQFLGQQPWYNFDYLGRLGQLWSGTEILGPHLLRKLERRYFLSSELLVKAAYGKLVGFGAGAVFQGVVPSTVVVVNQLNEELLKEGEIELVQDLGVNGAVLRLPRYAGFGPAAMKLAEAGVAFKEVAGNSSAILITVQSPANLEFPQDEGRIILFEQRSESNTDKKRIAVVTTVPELTNTLNAITALDVSLEHVYDY